MVEEIYSHFKGEGELDMTMARDLTDMAVSFAAISLHDPKRAVEWHKTFYGRILEDVRSYIPMPGLVITNAISMDGKELCRYIANETMHCWVIGAED